MSFPGAAGAGPRNADLTRSGWGGHLLYACTQDLSDPTQCLDCCRRLNVALRAMVGARARGDAWCGRRWQPSERRAANIEMSALLDNPARPC